MAQRARPTQMRWNSRWFCSRFYTWFLVAWYSASGLSPNCLAATSQDFAGGQTTTAEPLGHKLGSPMEK